MSVCEKEYESKYCTKSKRRTRNGLKLLISMPVDSFDYLVLVYCCLLSLFCAFCLLALDRNGLEHSSEL